jgi:hypothetical protein
VAAPGLADEPQVPRGLRQLLRAERSVFRLPLIERVTERFVPRMRAFALATPAGFEPVRDASTTTVAGRGLASIVEAFWEVRSVASIHLTPDGTVVGRCFPRSRGNHVATALEALLASPGTRQAADARLRVEMTSDDYSAGRRAARSAISAGVPRWATLRVSGASSEETDVIDRSTGLPVVVLHAPGSLAAQQAEFTRGHNDEILAAMSAGEITRDFRPLLVSAPDVDRAFKSHSLGWLDMNTPRLELPDLNMAVEVAVPNPRRGRASRFPRHRPSMIVLHRNGEAPKELSLYDGAVEVSVVRDGRVLLIRHKEVDLVFDVETTQILGRHARRAG